MFNPKNLALVVLLGPLSFIYRLFFKIDQLLKSIWRPVYHNQDIKIISCGNLLLGGSGKTPLVSWLTDYFTTQGLTVAILTRGYGRNSKKPILLNDSQNLQNWNIYGDEPFLLFKKHPQISVYIDANRQRAAKSAALQNDCLILDDGFQQLRIKKDLDLVLFDATASLTSLQLLPLGRLREPLSALHRASAIIITKVNLDRKNAQLIEKKLKPFAPNIPFFKAQFLPVGCLDVQDKLHQVAAFKGLPAKAIAGIGSPNSFLKTLYEYGIQVKDFKVFRDHHFYNHKELAKIIKPGETWITTEKDWIRLQEHHRLFSKLYRLKMSLVFDQAFQTFVNKKLELNS